MKLTFRIIVIHFVLCVELIKCLVLDLDETLVHSSFKPDFIIPVEIDRVAHHVYVLKRPYVDEFL